MVLQISSTVLSVSAEKSYQKDAHVIESNKIVIESIAVPDDGEYEISIEYTMCLRITAFLKCLSLNLQSLSLHVFFCALILGEIIFKWQYLIAFLLISFGIVLGNKSDKTREV